MHLASTDAQGELERLQDVLDPPLQLDEYELIGHIARTETALVYLASGPAFGDDEGILKITTHQYAPLIRRELALLVRCEQAEVDGIIRPLGRSTLQLRNRTVEGMALPLLSGGNLLDVIAAYGRRGRGSHFALQVAMTVGSALRGLLDLPRPIVHGDVRPANVLLPTPRSELTMLTLIDLDAARELSAPLPGIVADRQSAAALCADVRGFGELLFQAATGRESDDSPSLSSGNDAFDALVLRCLASMPDDDESYVCLADEALWRDMYHAIDVDRAATAREPGWRRALRR